MALTEVVETVQALILSSSQLSSQRLNTLSENLMQGLGTVQNTVVQAQASNTDDPALIAALQTASRAPRQGANDA